MKTILFIGTLIAMSSSLVGEKNPEPIKWVTILDRKENSYYLNGENYGEGDHAAKKIVDYLIALPQGSCVIKIIRRNQKDFFQTKDKLLLKQFYQLTGSFKSDKKVILEGLKENKYNFTIDQLNLLRWFNVSGDSTETSSVSFFLNGVFCGKGSEGFFLALNKIKESTGKKVLLIVGNQDYTGGLNIGYPFGYKEEMELVKILEDKGIRWLNRKRYSNQPIYTLKEIKQPPLPKELTNVSILGEYNDVPHSTLINNINKLLRQKDLQVQIYWTNSQMANKMIKHLEFEHTMISDVLRTIYIYDVRGKHIILKGIKE